ncbi:MAG: glycoside hydrolase family 2, partial [Cyclobacteriaceae bacterium]|nr:glycoside hydrolase family 2 [Cyclobacteriaceae bacterium]
VPFSFEIPKTFVDGRPHRLVIKADDKRRNFTLYGKQGYGNARGIWQTVYLEARGNEYLDAVHFTPDIDQQRVLVTAYLGEPSSGIPVEIAITTPQGMVMAQFEAKKGTDQVSGAISLPGMRLWTLDDPYLYEASIRMGSDAVSSYFGMRKISVVTMPGSEFAYVGLNNEPVYLQLTLDQSYHPDGFYTFPSDEFMKEEVARVKEIGLNGIRPHIKVEIPRKLYWADKLGVLVMADLPNSWGEPDAKMQQEATYTLRQMIKRDFNHASIFSWTLFNETWGLRTKVNEGEKDSWLYLPQTRQWVASMYDLAKSLDNTRLAEDNSICCGAGHTRTDINSFHDYLPGWEWWQHLQDISENSYAGSQFQFEEGFVQGTQPKINSECGNVWGYEGSTGDVDWSWDYHRMINAFRQFPEIAGWLYTEHHDVINEWNGYWRFDRTLKFTGVDDMVNGMTLADFHSPVYLSAGKELCMSISGGEVVQLPLVLSAMTGEDLGEKLLLDWELELTLPTGDSFVHSSGQQSLAYRPWIQGNADTLALRMPDLGGLAILRMQVKTPEGRVLHRNFMHFDILSGSSTPETQRVQLAPNEFSASDWSLKQWEILDGKKVNGAGKGYFDYTFSIPDDWKKTGSTYFLAELSAKELFAKDLPDDGTTLNVDYMLGGKVAASKNPNSYPMTDETYFSSTISLFVNGEKVESRVLPDDPADHRGVLSWHYQLKDRKLREAGSYGYQVKVAIPENIWKRAVKMGEIVIRLQTEGDGGIAVYGRSFGRYPWDPSLIYVPGK